MTANPPNGVVDNQQQHILDVMSTGHIRVALVGNVDAGKSTVAATLIRGQLDDGNGSNRILIAKHKHEIETGRTSSIATHLLGIDAHGDTISVPKNHLKNRPEAYIAPRAHRTVSLMDLAGHEKYFKTTVAGFARGAVDYALVIVNAAQPPTHMTQKHLHLCQMCGVQTMVVLTKTDSCPPDALRNTQQRVNEMIRTLSGKQPYATHNAKDVETVTNKLYALVPVLKVSCVTGEGLDVLRQMLWSIPRRRKHEKKVGQHLEFLVEETFNVTGVGTVLSGFVNMGRYKRGDPIVLGPCKDGTYIQTVAKSLHVAQTSVDMVTAGHSACFAVSLSKAERRMLSRKGMVILDGNKQPPPSASTSKTFQAEICLVRGAPMTVVKGRAQMTAHILHLKRTVKLIDFELIDPSLAPMIATKNKNSSTEADENSVLRPGQRAMATLAFPGGPQYVRSGMRIIFRDGHVRGFGKITQVGEE